MITDMTVAVKADSILSFTTAMNITNILHGALCIYFMHIVCTSVLLLLLWPQPLLSTTATTTRVKNDDDDGMTNVIMAINL